MGFCDVKRPHAFAADDLDGRQRSSFEVIREEPWTVALKCYEECTKGLIKGARPRPAIYESVGILEPFKDIISEDLSRDKIIDALEDAVGFPRRTPWVKQCLEYIWTHEKELTKRGFNPLDGNIYNTWEQAFRWLQENPDIEVKDERILKEFRKHRDWGNEKAKGISGADARSKRKILVT